MKKLFFVLVIIFLRYGTYAQELLNGDFSHFCGTVVTIPGVECSNDIYPFIAGTASGPTRSSFNTPCMENWFRVIGDPAIITGSSNVIHMQTAGYYDNPQTHGISETLPGSVGIAAGYPFLENGCYTVSIDVLSLTSECNGMELDVWATSGLTQDPTIVDCTGAPVTGAILIGKHVATAGETFSGVLSLTPGNFTATSSANDQILITVNDPSGCMVSRTSSLPGFATFSTHGIFDVNLQSVVITPCQGSCPDDILSVNQSLQIAAGNVFEHSLIEAGSSVAGGGLTTTVSPVISDNTVFLANDILLEPNFKAGVDNQHFFEAIPTTVCQCILKSPITSSTFSISPGGQITLSDAMQGGVWSISGPSLGSSISDQGVFTAGQVGQVTVTYTVDGCTASQNINVTEYHGGGGRQASTLNDTIYSVPQSISVFPNPAQNTITITYPCSADGQLDISIKDVAGRTLYTETVNCSEGANVQHSVDISSFTPGVYFVDLTINDQHVVRKIVKL